MLPHSPLILSELRNSHVFRTLLTRATFYDGFITGATIGATVLMIVFAYYLHAFDYRETTLAIAA